MDFFDSLKDLLPADDLPSAEEVDVQRESVFKAYDIRGTYPVDIDEAFAQTLAQAFIHTFAPKKVALGQDSRLSSPVLARALATQFLSEGIDVVDLGRTTTPFAAWVARTQKTDTIMVTASHNPKDQNGFKMYLGKTGNPLAKDTGIEDLERAYIHERTVSLPQPRKERGEVIRKERYYDEYKKAVMKAGLGTNKGAKVAGLRLAVDYSSGTTALFLNDVLRKLGVSFDTLNEKPDGTFPGHGPNPNSKDSWASVSHLVAQGKYHAGVLFDADGDRVVFFDERGQHIDTAVMAALFAHVYLPRAAHWKNMIVTTSLGRIARETAENVGGRSYVVPVGRTNVAPAMRKRRAELGVEGSGHYFFKDFDYAESGIVTLLKLLYILKDEGKKLSALIAPFQKYVTLPEISIPYEKGTKETVLRTIRRHFSGTTEALDGLSVMFKTWWFTIRRSNTEPLWRLTIEGEDRDTLLRKQKEIEAVVKNIKDLTK